jgi:hypothetical protein
MRKFTRKPMDDMDIPNIELDPKSRDDIPPLIRGLQYIFLRQISAKRFSRSWTRYFPSTSTVIMVDPVWICGAFL